MTQVIIDDYYLHGNQIFMVLGVSMFEDKYANIYEYVVSLKNITTGCWKIVTLDYFESGITILSDGTIKSSFYNITDDVNNNKQLIKL